MIKFKIKNENKIIEVSTIQEVVEYLNSTAKWKSESARQYMLDYSRRAVISQDLDIRATDYDSFVEDLVKVGEIELLP